MYSYYVGEGGNDWGHMGPVVDSQDRAQALMDQEIVEYGVGGWGYIIQHTANGWMRID